MDEPRVTTDSQDSPWHGLGGSHHLPPYSIFCAWPRDQHPNVILSWNSRDSESLWPLESLSKNSKIHWDSNSQNGSSFGNVKVHPLTLSFTLRSMRCDSRASPLAHTLASPYLCYEPKAKVTTILFNKHL